MTTTSTSWPPSAEFWADLPAKTAGITTPYLFKGIVPAAAADEAAVLTAFAALRAAHTSGSATSASARIYVGEDLRDDLLPTVLSAEPWAKGEFVSWMQHLIGETRFSLVINALETLNPALTAGLGGFLRALLAGWGAPIGGAELVAFIGNYAGTAFGIHEGYEHAFLTHYGPGPKDFYCWQPEEYRKITDDDAPTLGDYEDMLETGRKFVLEPGDALFLPERVFHVGRQKSFGRPTDFSISVAMPLYTYPDAGIARAGVVPELFESVLATEVDTEAGRPSAMIPLADGGAKLARRLETVLGDALSAAADRAPAACREHVHQRWHTLISNGGWQNVNHDLARDLAGAAFDPDQVTPGVLVQVTAPYELIVTGRQAFLRGYEIDVDPRALTPELVQALNSEPTALPDDARVVDAVRALGPSGGLTLAGPAGQHTDPSRESTA